MHPVSPGTQLAAHRGPSAGGYHAAGSRYGDEAHPIGFPEQADGSRRFVLPHALARAYQNIITTEALKLSRNLTT
jgi:hypothetical protein